MTQTANGHPRQGDRPEPELHSSRDATAPGRHTADRRRAAALRLPPLPGCRHRHRHRHRDPWDCQHADERLDDPTLDSWQVAASHLAEHDLPPVLPRDVRIALHQRESDRWSVPTRGCASSEWTAARTPPVAGATLQVAQQATGGLT